MSCVHPLENLVEKRNAWFGGASGRKIQEEFDRVLFFERDILVAEIWVTGGNVEKAKATGLQFLLERDRLRSAQPAPEPWQTS